MRYHDNLSLVCHVIALIYLCWPAVYGSYEGEQRPCDRYYIAKPGSGILSHQTYPFNYTSAMHCIHRFYVKYYHITSVQWNICFKFRRFSLLHTDRCTDDYLEFDRQYRFCGNGGSAINNSTNIFQPLCFPLAPGGMFPVQFVSRQKSTDLGYYAEYEISENPQTLNPIGTTTVRPIVYQPCNSSEFRCFTSGNCVPRSSLCDDVSDCADGSDESYRHARCLGLETIQTCSFEHDYCGFEGNGWERNKSLYTGPPFDNTYREYGKGMFVYSKLTLESTVSLKYSGLDPLPNQPHCLSFYYYMKAFTGNLLVYLTSESWNRTARIGWARSGTGVISLQSATWLKGEIELAPSLRLSEVRFEVVNTPSAVNSVGIDDVTLLPGNCYHDDISCTFDVDKCSWRHHFSVSHAFFNHTLVALSGEPTASDYTHLVAGLSPFKYGGGYMSASWSNDAPPSQAARIASRPVSHGWSGALCLMFQYVLSGSTTGSLSVLVFTTDISEPIKTVWVKNGNEGVVWKQGLVTLDSSLIKGPFEIIFDAIKGGGKTIVRLDDIVLNPGHCPNEPSLPPLGVPEIPTQSPPSTAHCQFGEISCHNGKQCYRREKECDQVRDCDDSSDEMYCSFEDKLRTLKPSTYRPVYTPCSMGQYRCNNHQCLPSHTRCDGKSDCQDGDDESYCSDYPLHQHSNVAVSAVIGVTVAAAFIAALLISCVIVTARRRSLAGCLRRRPIQSTTRSVSTNVYTSDSWAESLPPGLPSYSPSVLKPLCPVEPPAYSSKEVIADGDSPPTYENSTSPSPLTLSVNEQIARFNGKAVSESEI